MFHFTIGKSLAARGQERLVPVRPYLAGARRLQDAGHDI